MVEPIRTNTGWVAHGHNLYRGFSLRDDLTDDGIWSLMSLALGHRRLSPQESRYLDGLAAALPAPDPRLYPTKMMWLIGCRGSAYAALAAAHLTMASCRVGPGCMPGAAELWQELRSSIAALGRKAAFEAWIEEYAEVPFPKLSGFGAPARQKDERLELIERAANQHGFTEGPYYQIFIGLQEVLKPTKIRVNVYAAFAACALDLGLDPEQLGMLGEFILQVPLWANAADAARMRPSALMRIDDRDIEYVGPEPRRSPRAQHSSGEPQDKG